MATPTDPLAGAQTGQESSLSNWAGPYVTDMLGRGQALANQGYQAYQGPLTAGPSDLQNQAFQGIGNLTVPTAEQTTFNQQSFTDPGVSQQFMNPYMQSALAPQLDELRRQSEISQQNQNSQLSKAGAFGGSRQAVMNAELDRNLQDQMAQTLNTGYMNAYNQGAGQFNTEQALGLQGIQQNQRYGLEGLNAQANMGNLQRNIEQEGINADMMQFNEERADPYKQTQFMQSLLQGLPVQAQSYNYQQPTGLNQFLGTTGGIAELLRNFGTITTPSAETP